VSRWSQLVDRAVDRADAWIEARRWRQATEAPLIGRPLGSAEQYRELWERGKRDENAAIDAYEARMGAAIDREWFHALGLLTQVAIKTSPVCYFHGRLLYAALRRFAAAHPNEPLTVVETGTARGFATLCMARALSDAGAGGRVLTFDVLPHETPILWNCLLDEDGPRSRKALLADYADLIERYIVFYRGNTRIDLRKLAFPRVHLALLDSVHTYDHVMAEYDAIRGRQRAGDFVFFDDYTPEAYPGVVQAADEICRRDGYSTTVIEGGPGRRYLIAEKR
jgi:hypothetical protein